MSDSPRRIDVRVGSSTDGLAPVSFAERSLAAGPLQWVALAAIALAAVAADQLTKHIAGTEARLGNKAFTDKAPPVVIDGAKKQLAEQQAKKAELERLLKSLG